MHPYKGMIRMKIKESIITNLKILTLPDLLRQPSSGPTCTKSLLEAARARPWTTLITSMMEITYYPRNPLVLETRIM